MISFAASIEKGYPFRKMRRILLVGALVAGGDRLTPTEPAGETSPKPSEISFTTYYTTQGNFAKVGTDFFKKFFSFPTTEDVLKMPMP